MALKRMLLAVLAIEAIAARAHAEDSARTWRVMVGIERVAGGHHYGVNQTNSMNQIMAPTSVAGRRIGDDVYALWSSTQNPMVATLMAPRLAIDWTRGGLTLGAGAFAWFSHSVGHYGIEDENGYLFRTEADTTFFGVAPRIGWLACNARGTCFWPKLGFSVADVRTVQTTFSYSKAILPTEIHTDHIHHAVGTIDVEPTLLLPLNDHVSFNMTFAINRVVAPFDVWVAGVAFGVVLSR